MSRARTDDLLSDRFTPAYPRPLMLQIDKTTYDKAKYTNAGYEPRKAAPTSLVVHSTSNPHQKNTEFSAEADFLYKSRLVSAHFLLGKDGRCVQFLDPLKWAAWHAGNARVAWVNQKSIGIELHHSVGDPPYPKQQIDALTELTRLLMAQFSIPPTLVETHGQIAIKGPYDRKHDPSDWSYESFLVWQHALTTPPVSLPIHTYKVIGLPIYQKQTLDGPLAGHLATGERVEVDKVYPNGGAHLKDGRGFVLMSGLEETQ